MAKTADIIGPYLNPPENASVMSIDEKPSIQASERATGYVHTSNAKIVQGFKSTYKRHGAPAKPFGWRKREVKGSQLRYTIVNSRNQVLFVTAGIFSRPNRVRYCQI